MKNNCDCITYCGDDPTVIAGTTPPCSMYVAPHYRGAIERFSGQMLSALQASAPTPTLSPALKDLVRRADPVAVALYAANLWRWEAGAPPDEAPAPPALETHGERLARLVRTADSGVTADESEASALEKRREQCNLTTKAFAAVLGLQQSHYSEVINGRRRLPVNAIARAVAVGVCVSPLLANRGHRPKGGVECLST